MTAGAGAQTWPHAVPGPVPPDERVPFTTGATGPGALCWCGCGQRLWEDRRTHARYLHAAHRTAASRARRALAATGAPLSPPKANRKRTRAPRRGLQVYIPDLAGALALSVAIRDLAEVDGRPAVIQFQEALEAAIDRKKNR